MKEKPLTLREYTREPKGRRMSRKGLFREIFGCCCPGRQKRKPPRVWSALHFPVTNITARHYQDCHTQTSLVLPNSSSRHPNHPCPPKLLLNTAKLSLSSQTALQCLQVKGLMLTAALWELTAPKLQRQLSAGWDWAFSPPELSSGTQNPAAKSCCSPSTSPKKPGEE